MSDFMTGVAVGAVGTLVVGGVGYGVYALCKSDDKEESGADAAYVANLEKRVKALEDAWASLDLDDDAVEPEAPAPAPQNPAQKPAANAVKKNQQVKADVVDKKGNKVAVTTATEVTKTEVEVVEFEDTVLPEENTGKQYPKNKGNKGDSRSPNPHQNKGKQRMTREIHEQETREQLQQATDIMRKVNNHKGSLSKN